MQAIDVWLGLCMAFVFAALVEFTIVNFWFRKSRAGYRQEPNVVKICPRSTTLFIRPVKRF